MWKGCEAMVAETGKQVDDAAVEAAALFPIRDQLRESPRFTVEQMRGPEYPREHLPANQETPLLVYPNNARFLHMLMLLSKFPRGGAKSHGFGLRKVRRRPFSLRGRITGGRKNALACRH